MSVTGAGTELDPVLLTIHNDNGFTLLGRPETTEPDGLVQDDQTPGTLAAALLATDTNGDEIAFSDADVSVDSVAVGETWRVYLNDTLIGEHKADSIDADTMAQQLSGDIEGHGDYTSSPTGSSFSIAHAAAADFTVRLEIVAPIGQATAGAVAAVISGTPDPADVSVINWSEVTLALSGTPQAGEDWTITVGGVDYTVTAGADRQHGGRHRGRVPNRYRGRRRTGGHLHGQRCREPCHHRQRGRQDRCLCGDAGRFRRIHGAGRCSGGHAGFERHCRRPSAIRGRSGSRPAAQ